MDNMKIVDILQDHVLYFRYVTLFISMTMNYRKLRRKNSIRPGLMKEYVNRVTWVQETMFFRKEPGLITCAQFDHRPFRILQQVFPDKISWIRVNIFKNCVFSLSTNNTDVFVFDIGRIAIIEENLLSKENLYWVKTHFQ